MTFLSGLNPVLLRFCPPFHTNHCRSFKHVTSFILRTGHGKNSLQLNKKPEKGQVKHILGKYLFAPVKQSSYNSKK